MTVTKLDKAEDVRAAQLQFEKNVTSEVYEEHFSAIGAAFKGLQSMIGKASYVYVKCEKEGAVVGMAYGYKEAEGIFYIADIISKAGSHSGTEMVNWFGNKDLNTKMPNLRMLKLTAAHVSLQESYKKPHYGFSLMNEHGLMKKDV